MKSIYFKSLSILLSFILVVTQTLYVSAKPIDLKLIQIEEKDLIPDEVSLTKAFNQLDKLDNYLAANEEITFNNKSETKKALNGCLVSGGAVVVVYLLIIVFYGTLIASSEYTY